MSFPCPETSHGDPMPRWGLLPASRPPSTWSPSIPPTSLSSHLHYCPLWSCLTAPSIHVPPICLHIWSVFPSPWSKPWGHHSLNTYLSNSYHVPGTELGTETTGIHKTSPAHSELLVVGPIKQAHQQDTAVAGNLGSTETEHLLWARHYFNPLRFPILTSYFIFQFCY